jgi:hypothetical protein
MVKQTARQIAGRAARRTAMLGGLIAALSSGCLSGGRVAPARTTTPPDVARLQPSPTELGATVAKIVSVNSEHAFVVIDFGAQVVPSAGTWVNVYRNEKRVGAVRITEPVRAPLATADIVEGELHVGDEVR